MSSMKAYVIVSRDQKSIFGRTDEEFFGAIWFYPNREIAEDHCGPAGMVIEIEVGFPSDVAFLLVKEGKVDHELPVRHSRPDMMEAMHLAYGTLDSVLHAADAEKAVKAWIPAAMAYLKPYVVKKEGA